MIIWIDAHLSPAIATWITASFGITAFALRDIDLRDTGKSQQKAFSVIIPVVQNL
jgi:predicted nuclease of predicted toxin-antitoxin system